MPIKYCKQCVRFDRPKDTDATGFCTQCGEDTNAYAVACYCSFRGRRHIMKKKELIPAKKS